VIPYRAKSPQAGLRLFCFPFAGGNASVFRTWVGAASSIVDVCPVELPGHGSRIQEALVDDLRSLAAQLIAALGPLLDEPYALFGHSLGGRIAFEIERQRPGARHLFISASLPPHLPRAQPVHTLHDRELRAQLAELGGTPPELLAHDELMEILLPILRSDFKATETYSLHASATVQAPMSVLAGSHDTEVSIEKSHAWRAHAGGAFELIEIQGGHFFLVQDPATILRLVTERLQRA
jgi:medium-chain acyl-[acyl-carrier-protein] hydrolase